MLDLMPLWLVFFLTIAICFIAIELGYRVAVFRKGKSEHIDNNGVLVQATLGLVAFILAFTFGTAADRYNDRRLLIIDEANSIGTTYLRADFLPESRRIAVQDLFRQYVDLRINPGTHTTGNLAQKIKESEHLQDLLWAQTVIIGKADMGSDVIALFIDSMNETLDLQEKRVAAGLYARIPDTNWAALYIMVLIGMSGMGYQSGTSGARNLLASFGLVIAFSIVITMIVDLDRPQDGFLKASTKPLEDLAKKIGTPKSKLLGFEKELLKQL